WTSHATLGPAATADFAFAAPPGAKLSVSAKPTTRTDLVLPRIVSITAPDGTDLVPAGRTLEKGKTASFALKTPLDGGDYRVAFGARDAGAGDVTWTVKLHVSKRYLFALPDLPAGE